MKKEEPQSYAQAVEKLQQIVEQIEEENPPVDELLEKTEEAVRLIKYCREQLTQTDKKVQALLAALDDQQQEPEPPGE